LSDPEEFTTKYTQRVFAFYDKKEKDFGPQMLRNVERMILLEVIDSKWKDHLRGMDELREGIGLRAYGQKDPVVEYRQEAFQMFEEMTRKIREDSISFVFRAQPMRRRDVELEEPKLRRPKIQFIHPEAVRPTKMPAEPKAQSAPGGDPRIDLSQKPGGTVQSEKKVGRNDPCPCGSGKKYKKCHGA